MIVITSGVLIRKGDTGVLWARDNILYLYTMGGYTSITQEPSCSLGCTLKIHMVYFVYVIIQ